MQHWTKAVVCAAFMVALLPTLGRADYYSYTKENGSKGFADELKSVPARYRDSAVRHEERPLSDYSRLTIVEKTPAATLPVCDPCTAELAPALARQGAFRSRAQELDADLQDDASNAQESDGEEYEPITVERHVHRWIDGRYRPYTIVRRGERVLRIVRER